jgi:AraC-like DNA-binding protein
MLSTSAPERAAVQLTRLELGQTPVSLGPLGSGDLDHALLEVIGIGAVVTRRDDRIVLRPGEILVLDLRTQPPAWVHGSGRLLALGLAQRDSTLHAAGFASISDRVLGATNPYTGVVGHLLREVGASPLMLESSRVARHLTGFVDLLCTEAARSAGSPGASGILGEAEHHIEAHLDDLALSPSSVARALNVSTRTLHRQFEQRGDTIGGWIRHRRLENCRADLEDVTSQVPVSAIGARWGLCDAAHFSRLFKSAYGASPTTYRQEARARAVHRAA